MGAGRAGGNGGNRLDRTNPNKPPVSYSPPKKTNPIKKAIDFVAKNSATGIVVRTGKKIVKGTKERIKKNKLKKEGNVELGLGKDRMSNYTEIQGGTAIGNAGDKAAIEQQVMDNTYYRNLKGSKYYREPKDLIIKTAGSTAPTEAELSQSAAADADDIYTRRKKSKARGRSMMTLTSSKGVTDNKLTLGKPSLLGK